MTLKLLSPSLLVLLMLVTACQSPNVKSQTVADADSSKAESASEGTWSPEVTWDIVTTEGTYNMPESIVTLVANGIRIPVAHGPGLKDMSVEERTRFGVPPTAILAASGYFAGFGVNIYVEIIESEIAVFRAIWDEQADPALGRTYAKETVVKREDLANRLNNPGERPSFQTCFEGKVGTTTSTFDITIHNGVAIVQRHLTIEDHANAYFTSATAAGSGILLGERVYVKLTTRIENDVQKSVEVWVVTPNQLTVDGAQETEKGIYPPCI